MSSSTDIIARGMANMSQSIATEAKNKADLAIEKISDFPTGLNYKGSVEKITDLPTNASIGDAYNVIKDNNNEYAWNGTAWSLIGADNGKYTNYIIVYDTVINSDDIEDIINRFNNGQQIIVIRDSHVGTASESHLQYVMVRYSDNYLYFENSFAYSGDPSMQMAMVWINRETCAWSKEVFRTYKDSYIDENIDNAFMAIYNQTSFNDIKTAFDANKVIKCKSGSVVYDLTSCDSSTITFTKITYAVNNTTYPSRFQLVTFTVTKNGDSTIYSDPVYKYIETSRANGGSLTKVDGTTSKVSVIDDINAAVDRAFPNVKAVKDYVDAHQGSGGSEIFKVTLDENYEVVSYYPTDYEEMKKCNICRVEFSNTKYQFLVLEENSNGLNFRYLGDGGILTVEGTSDLIYYSSDTDLMNIKSISVNGETLPKSDDGNVELIDYLPDDSNVRIQASYNEETGKYSMSYLNFFTHEVLSEDIKSLFLYGREISVIDGLQSNNSRIFNLKNILTEEDEEYTRTTVEFHHISVDNDGLSHESIYAIDEAGAVTYTEVPNMPG